jgi:hypothetical protein
VVEVAEGGEEGTLFDLCLLMVLLLECLLVESSLGLVVGAKAKTPPFAPSLRCSRWSGRDKTGRDTLRLIGTRRRPATTSSHSAASSSSEAHVRSGPS